MKSEERSWDITIMLATIIFETYNNISVIGNVAKKGPIAVIQSTNLNLLQF
jgi:hypothetical protein